MPPTRIMVIVPIDVLFPSRRRGRAAWAISESPTFDDGRWDFLQVIGVAVRGLPALREAAITHSWAGLYEVTPDANPLIGAVPGRQGFHLIAGFSGHGFQHSPAAGRILADVMTGRDPGLDLAPFALERFAARQVGGERYVV